MAISTKPLALLLSLLAFTVLPLLTGCSTTKEKVIPQNGPDMQQIYSQHMQRSGAHSDPLRWRDGFDRSIGPGKADLRGYTREAANEVEQVFPLLPNPQMVLYVFPHLSGEGAPVPGYATAFPLYPVDQYALPGELYQP